MITITKLKLALNDHIGIQDADPEGISLMLILMITGVTVSV